MTSIQIRDVCAISPGNPLDLVNSNAKDDRNIYLSELLPGKRTAIKWTGSCSDSESFLVISQPNN